jgi:hypothetical protein
LVSSRNKKIFYFALGVTCSITGPFARLLFMSVYFPVAFILHRSDKRGKKFHFATKAWRVEQEQTTRHKISSPRLHKLGGAQFYEVNERNRHERRE